MSTTKNYTRPAPAAFPGLDFIYRSSGDGVDENLLVLFHGMGDLPANFIQFAIKMNLPQTALLALKAPLPVPFHEGTCWAPVYDYDGNEHPPSSPKMRQAVVKTRNLVSDFLSQRVLAPADTPPNDRRLWWPARNVFLLGFSQGGAAAMDVALFGGLGSSGGSSGVSSSSLGGTISISGWPSEASYAGSSLPKLNPGQKILVTQGDRDDVVDNWKSEAEFWKRALTGNGHLAVQIIPGKGHSMPTGAVEMRAIMSFLGPNLVLRNLALESMADVYEVKTS
ncbi:hypothetical protein HDU87_000041 [Geranomyces variabilis]|uniref:Phospholipase/carboxylesterase/thioesterase domain-containing protein n=1 Tax=Geranomyces variabilis TaxID=109894 RepID=A0AAD5TS93_9FUNG|nr:hypothetical protein HDU87_000041 [Geranomyces variabilis]